MSFYKNKTQYFRFDNDFEIDSKYYLEYSVRFDNVFEIESKYYLEYCVLFL